MLAIKQTLYRTSGDSPIIDALVEASQAGKQVLALVEIKARFDEQANIAWARKLEKAGCHVVYGMLGPEDPLQAVAGGARGADGLRRYCHIGTGNYNPKTARMYEDMGLLTSNPVITDDVARLFNHLSGMAQETHYKRLLVAPHGVRRGLLENIEHRDRQPPGRACGSGVRIKVNSIVDEAVIDALYRASQAGVPVDLWVRGICSVKPGVPGLSENIRVRSILGRFLEHSRLYWFANGGRPPGRDRLLRPDAPQPRPPGGGDRGRSDQPQAHRPDRGPVRPRVRRGHGVVVARRRHLDAEAPWTRTVDR